MKPIGGSTLMATPRSRRLVAALRALNQATVSQLSSVTGVSRPTLTAIIAELEAAGLVHQVALEAASGRPAAVYSLRPMGALVVGLDLLDRTAAITIADIRGEIIASDVLAIDPQEPHLLHKIATQVLLVLEASDCPRDALVAAAVSATGIVDHDGKIVRSNLIPQWAGLNLAAELERFLDVPVVVENDINASAYGEYAVRVANGEIDPGDALLFVQLASRGIHTGLVLNGAIHRGHWFNAGEITDVLGGPVLGDEPEHVTAGWVNSAALTVGAVSAVVDPRVIVVSATTQAERERIGALSAKLSKLRPATAPPVQLEPSELGLASASIGAISLALEASDKLLFGGAPAQALPLTSMATVITTHNLGDHTTMHQERQRENVEPAPLKVGVIGIGARSKLALHAEADGNNARISAVCDPHHLLAQRVQDRLERPPSEVTLTTSVAELVKTGIDVAFVTSPDDTHESITIELLEAGIPVYLEKPLAITIDGATAILEAAYRTGTKLYVGHNMRHMHVVRTMRDLIRQGRIGEVKAIWCRHFVGSGGDFYFKDWHATREHGTGLLLQKAAHDIDVMHWLADSHTNEVVGMGDLMVYGQIADRKDRSDELMHDWHSMGNWPPLTQRGLNPVIDVEDMSMMLMKLDSGVMASYQQCHFTPDYWRNYTVIGTEGRIENFGDSEGGVIKLWNQRTRYKADGDEQFPILGDDGFHTDADKLTVAEFLRFVRAGGATDTSPLGAWYSVGAGIMATESIRNGSKPQQLPQLREEIIDYFNNNQVKRSGQAS